MVENGKKVQRHFWLKPDDLDYIQKVKEDCRCSSATKALELIIEEHRHLNKSTSQVLAAAVEEQLKDTLTRIRIAANSTEKSTLILLDMINALCAYQGIPGGITIQNSPSSAYITGKDHIEALKRSYRAAAFERRKTGKK